MRARDQASCAPGETAHDTLALLALARLLQLASPALPIGAYSYSQGQEWVVAAGTVHDAASAQAWIADMLVLVVARGEAAVAWRLLCAAGTDHDAFARWNAWFRATRETAELRAETEQMGGSLVRLAQELAWLDAAARDALRDLGPVTLPAAYALAARACALPARAALAAYVWAWLENQVLAAMKLVPLGQVAGQRILAALSTTIPEVVGTAARVADDDIVAFAPGFALACAKHETQYTRLFRS